LKRLQDNLHIYPPEKENQLLGNARNSCGVDKTLQVSPFAGECAESD